MGCQHLDEIYELYLLGSLAEEESSDLRQHVERGCPTCLERLRDATRSIYLLTLTARRARPDPRLKARLLRRLRKK